MIKLNDQYRVFAQEVVIFFIIGLIKLLQNIVSRMTQVLKYFSGSGLFCMSFNNTFYIYDWPNPEIDLNVVTIQVKIFFAASNNCRQNLHVHFCPKVVIFKEFWTPYIILHHTLKY